MQIFAVIARSTAEISRGGLIGPPPPSFSSYQNSPVFLGLRLTCRVWVILDSHAESLVIFSIVYCDFLSLLSYFLKLHKYTHLFDLLTYQCQTMWLCDWLVITQGARANFLLHVQWNTCFLHSFKVLILVHLVFFLVKKRKIGWNMLDSASIEPLDSTDFFFYFGMIAIFVDQCS